jgi:TolB-like protein/AraC-like DNA-binding protein
MNSSLSMDQEFIKKLTNLLEVNLENEQFGVNELAEELGISRSQLHRKLNALTGKSTSQFIREFRLEKAMEMLQNNVATASEIAYRVGFGSPTYFNTSFSEYYGYPPGEVKFRTSVTDGDEEDNQTSGQENTSDDIEIEVGTGKPIKQRNILMASLGIIAIIVAFLYYFYDGAKDVEVSKTDEIATLDKSIAVLPFKNLSNNKDNQYFADGMREDIINHLSKMQGIIVKSRQSSDRYGSSILTDSEIGEALGVNYIIDGSVQKYGEQIKIIVHLINASNDTHIWSQDFDRKFDNIFSLESEISKLIATELDIILTPAEIIEIEKIPTQYVEAYNLYLKGQYFFYSKTDKGFKLSEKYFNESIALDPEFALAYSGLARCHLYKNWPRASEEDYLNAKANALKAVRLDNNLAESHSALALIYAESEWNWVGAEKEFKRAIELDPNNATVYIYYANYLMHVRGDFNKCREYINKALLLDPIAYYFYVVSAEAYLTTENYDFALKEANKAKEINPENLWAHWIIFLVNVQQGNDDNAVKELAISWSINPEHKVNVEPMLAAYKDAGIEGIFRWINNLDIEYADAQRTMHNSYWIAEKFAFLGEYDKAMEWLEIAYQRKNRNLYWIKYDYYFTNMHGDTRFLALLEKMNLGNYQDDIPFKD